MNQCHLAESVTGHCNDFTIWDMTPRYLDTFGKRVRVLRTGVGLTQQKLVDALEAEGVPIGRSYVSEWERSDKTPTGDIVAALARILGTTADYLLMLTEEDQKPGPQPAVEAMSEEAEAVAHIVDAMMPARRQDVLAVVRALHQRETGTQQRRYDTFMQAIFECYGVEGVRLVEEFLARLLDSPDDFQRLVGNR